MRSCKIDSVADIKEMLYESHLSQDSIAKKGMDILSKRLQEPEIEQRIKDISDFWKIKSQILPFCHTYKNILL